MTAPAKFVWYDVMTTDMRAAESFYTRVVGWSAKDSGMPNGGYTLFSAGDTMAGGLMPIPEDAARMGVRPAWMGYIGVDNVDECAARVRQAGGKVHKAPQDIPNVGRFAVCGGPGGEGFIIYQSNNPAPPSAPDKPGFVGWRELHGADLKRDWNFYSSLFGWTKDQAMDMGPMGTYQLWKAGDQVCGGMMTKGAEEPGAHWIYYINVASITAAEQRIKDAGGKILHGPAQVPGDMWIINALDPQGALFALLGPK